MLTVSVVLFACVDPAVELQLDGPVEVVVDELGEVAGPVAKLSDGSLPEGVVWSVSSARVARVEGGQVIAAGAGTTTVVGSWEAQEVSWTLRVEPSMRLVFVEPPATIAVGESVPLKVVVEGAGTPDGLVFRSSHPTLVRVDTTGVATGVAPGVGYITVSAPGGESMLEVRVVPAL